MYETSNKNWFWSIKNSGEVLSKLKCRGFRATSLSTYDFSTLYTTLPHNLIKEKLLDLIEWTFKRTLKNYGSLYLACNDRKAFFTSSNQSRYTPQKYRLGTISNTKLLAGLNRFYMAITSPSASAVVHNI